MSTVNKIFKAELRNVGRLGKLVINNERPDIFDSTSVIQPFEWREFCDEINESLKALNYSLLLYTIIWLTYLTALFFIFILRLLEILPVYWSDYVIFPCGMILIVSVCYTYKKAEDTVMRIDEVCEEYTNKFREKNMSFTFDIRYSENVPVENRRKSGRPDELLKRKPNCFIKIEILFCNGVV